jgi:shikimate kinase
MGAGKSTLGEALAERLKVSWIDSDLWVEQTQQRSIQEIITAFGWPAFRAFEQEFTMSMASREPLVISCGGGFPLAKENWHWISEHCTSIYLKVDVELLYDRLLKNQGSRPLLANLNQESLKLFITSELKHREPIYEKANVIVNGNGTVQETISLLEALI